MYLNLDLLYNVDIYLFPLFYYRNKSFFNKIFRVYSPMTKKSMYIEIDFDCKYIYCDHITFVYKNKNIKRLFDYDINIYLAELYTKCKPFFLEKKYIEYLKSNKRIIREI